MNNNEDCTVTATVDVRQAQIHPSTLWTPTKVAERHSRPDQPYSKPKPESSDSDNLLDLLSLIW
jgi:hypothetical protein